MYWINENKMNSFYKISKYAAFGSDLT